MVSRYSVPRHTYVFNIDCQKVNGSERRGECPPTPVKGWKWIRDRENINTINPLGPKFAPKGKSMAKNIPQMLDLRPNHEMYMCANGFHFRWRSSNRADGENHQGRIWNWTRAFLQILHVTRVARFFGLKHTKRGKIYLICTKYTKRL